MPEVGVFASVVSQKGKAGEAGASGKGQCEVRERRLCLPVYARACLVFVKPG